MGPQAIGESGKGESSGGRERRRSRRFGCEGFAEGFVFDTGAVFRGEIRDISQSGCYIMTKARLKLERLAEVDLLFTLKERKYRTLARVMVVRPGNGVGLEFLFYNPQGGESLKEEFMTLFEEAMQEEA